jgi:hypothetical protein
MGADHLIGSAKAKLHIIGIKIISPITGNRCVLMRGLPVGSNAQSLRIPFIDVRFNGKREWVKTSSGNFTCEIGRLPRENFIGPV